MNRMFRKGGIVIIVTALAPVSLPMAAQTPESAELRSPVLDYALDVRYRYESVSQDNDLADAEASTVRSRLTLTGHFLPEWKAVIEADNVSTLGPDHYDSLVDDQYRGTHSVVADPTGTDLNQLNLDYEWHPGNGMTLGRQRIVHDNQRFIGGVAWRQNEQTYDGGTLRLAGEQAQFSYSYISEVQRIFGSDEDSVQPESLDGDIHLLHSDFSTPAGEFSAFIYTLDFRRAPGLSSRTVGLQWSDQMGPLGLKAGYAQQADHADHPMDFRTDYLFLEGSAPIGPIRVTAGYERLGSDDGRIGFSTPLATLHKFQGWADVFLSTPGSGMEDAYLGLSGSLGSLSLNLVYHDYRAHRGSMHYGSEWNLQAGYKFSNRISTALKYASYDADDFASNTEKLWFTLQFAF